MSSSSPSHHYMVEEIRIGLMQTSLDYRNAWTDPQPKITKVEEERAIEEILAFLSSFGQDPSPPEIILIPELSVPRGFEATLKKIALTLGAVIIAGLDYRISSLAKSVKNEAILIVPKEWMGKKIGSKVSSHYVGKTYPAPMEKVKLEKIGYDFTQDPTVQIFDGGEAGRFGIAVCYDLLDLERVALYRGQIHHLFVLAYNRDTRTFDHVAEALSRMIFCNVIICNCGHYGGSLAVSPKRKPELRTIYHHSGAELTTAQIISLPVRKLEEHLQNPPGPRPINTTFKSLPPGFAHHTDLIKSRVKIEDI
jgi:hypothetical protein